MKKRVKPLILTAAVMALLWGATGNSARAQIGCGIEPVAIKPIPPPGCRDMIHRCVCSTNGACYWVWVCV